MFADHSHVFLERKQTSGRSERVMASSLRPGGISEETWLDSVIDDRTQTPPASPAVGDRYIIPCGAAGAWAGLAGQIAEWVGNGWRFTIPRSGSTVWVRQRSYLTTFLQLPQLEGPDTDVDADFWFPHHLIDASHTIYPGTITDRLDTPPVSPALYSSYIVTATATGAWAGHETQIAISVCNALTNSRVWAFVNAREGDFVWVEDENLYYVFNGSAWEPLPQWVLNRGYLNDLADASGTPTLNYVLTWNGSGWVPQATQFIPHALGQHTDVDIDTPADGDVLVYDSGTSTWINVAIEDAPVGDHTLGVPHTNVSDSVDTAPVGKLLGTVGSSGQWAAVDLPDHTHPISEVINLQVTLDDLQDQIDGLGGGGGGGTGTIVGAIHYPSPSGPWAVYYGTGFSVSDASGGTITFSTSRTAAFGQGDNGEMRIAPVGFGTTWVVGLGSPPTPAGTIFAFTAQ